MPAGKVPSDTAEKSRLVPKPDKERHEGHHKNVAEALCGNYDERVAKEAPGWNVLKRRIGTNKRNHDRDAQAEAEKREEHREEHIQQIGNGAIHVRGSVRLKGALSVLR